MSIQTKPKSHTVCSLHFDKTMIKNLPQLKSDAVPTISLPNSPSTSDINTNANCKDVSTQTEEAFIEIFSTVSIKGPGSKSSRGQTASGNDMDKTTQTSHTLLPTTPIKHKLQGEYEEAEQQRRKLQHELNKISKSSESFKYFSFESKNEVSKRIHESS